MSQQQAASANTLFGELTVTMEIPPPRISEVTPWPLVVQLEHENEVAGIYLSGHPLDNYRFEIKHYGITPISVFNEFRDTISQQANPGVQFRLVGLVTDAQHRIAKSGNKYGNFVIEDYSGKLEFPLFSDDYLRLSPILQPGSSVLIIGFLKQRFNRNEFEFKLSGVTLAETMMANMTKSLTIEVQPKDISDDMIRFFEKNLKSHPGKTTFKLILNDLHKKMKVNLIATSYGIQVNPELVHYLEKTHGIGLLVQAV
jgi:DNA polymerase-3 subunit alpha